MVGKSYIEAIDWPTILYVLYSMVIVRLGRAFSAALTVTVTMKMVNLLDLINMIWYSLSPILYWTSCTMFVISDLLSGLYHVYRTTCQCINSYGCAITKLYSYQKVSFVYWHISEVQLLICSYCLFCDWASFLVCMWDMAKNNMASACRLLACVYLFLSSSNRDWTKRVHRTTILCWIRKKNYSVKGEISPSMNENAVIAAPDILRRLSTIMRVQVSEQVNYLTFPCGRLLYISQSWSYKQKTKIFAKD